MPTHSKRSLNIISPADINAGNFGNGNNGEDGSDGNEQRRLGDNAPPG